MKQSENKKRVVITGSGIASAVGNEFETYCHNLYQGKYGIQPITTFDTSGQKTKIAATLDPLPAPRNISRRQLKNCSSLSKVALYCTEQALQDSQLDLEEVDSDRMGVIVGSGHLNIYDLEAQFQRFFQDGTSFSPRTVPSSMASSTPSQIAIAYGINGIVKMVSTACASGFSAIVESVEAIRNGQQDVMLSGGVDLVVCPTVMNAWESLRVVTEAGLDVSIGCRPFHQERTGVSLGDGAAFFVIESYEHAIARRAPILAEISGMYQNADSIDIVKPQIDKEIACIAGALTDAGRSPETIDMIFAHATGTPLNDSVEVASLSEVFGPQLAEIPVCGLKSMLGHTMGASGPMSLMAALGSLQHNYFYPIPNLNEVDETLDICTTEAGKLIENVDHILLNTFAFGGINVCLVLSRIVESV